MTSDLISRSALMELYADTEDIHFAVYNVPIPVVRQNILDAPAVDAVEVVHCKDCKYYESTHYGHMCKCWEAWLPTTVYFIREDDDFCSYGEKRSGEHE